MAISFSNGYTLLNWRDRIWKIGADGKLIPKRDSNGQIQTNPLTGQPEYETIEEGTRVSANRLNHMDEGIYAAHDLIVDLNAVIRRMQVQLELDGRVPGNSGSFMDPMDGTTSRSSLLNASTDITSNVSRTDTVIPVSSTVGFKPMTYVTIYDANNYEHVLISEIDVNSITVQALTHDYSKGAKIARSTTTANTATQTLEVAPFTEFNVSIVEVV